MDPNQINKDEQDSQTIDATGDTMESEQNESPQEVPVEEVAAESSMNQETNPEALSVEGDKKSLGPVVGVIVIVGVLILGGFYYWTSSVEEVTITAEEIVAQEDEAVMILEKQGTSDEVVDIEGDLTVTDLEGLDAELADIEKELTF